MPIRMPHPICGQGPAPLAAPASARRAALASSARRRLLGQDALQRAGSGFWYMEGHRLDREQDAALHERVGGDVAHVEDHRLRVGDEHLAPERAVAPRPGLARPAAAGPAHVTGGRRDLWPSDCRAIRPGSGRRDAWSRRPAVSLGGSGRWIVTTAWSVRLGPSPADELPQQVGGVGVDVGRAQDPVPDGQRPPLVLRVEPPRGPELEPAGPSRTVSSSRTWPGTSGASLLVRRRRPRRPRSRRRRRTACARR